MENYETIILLYILFIWFVVIHTFEEISQDVFGLKIGPIKASRKKYLFGASVISTINLATVGFLKEGRKPEKLGAGFYTSLPLAIGGALLLYNIFQEI